MSRIRQNRLVAYLEYINRREGGLETVSEAESTLLSAQTESVLASMPELPQKDAALELANGALRKLKANPDIDLPNDELAAIEAIIIPDKRPAFDVQDGDFTANHPLWLKLNSDQAMHARLTRAIAAIGRIDLPGQSRLPYGGSGFLIGPNLLMTNRHVAEIFATGLGDRSLRFVTGRKATIDFRHERDRDATEMLEVRNIVMIHPYWDMALLSVSGATAYRTPLRLSLESLYDLDGHEVVTIGYPAYDPLRNDVDVQNKLFGGIYGVKKLQPGLVGQRRQVESFKKLVPAGTHDCSTLGGNSGSALIDLTTGDVLGLHFGGRYLDTNFAVPASELARDGRVVDAGVFFAGTPGRGTPSWSNYWEATEATESDSEPRRQGEADTSSGNVDARASSQKGTGVTVPGSGSVSFSIPLHITVTLGDPGTKQVASVASLRESVETELDLIEKMVPPAHDDEMLQRNGYSPDFLGTVTVPMPEAMDPRVLAPVRAGGMVLNYQNFSLQMHATRRIALFTASNVTTEKSLKTPEANRDYSRRGLSGLGPTEIEQWLAEPRLDAKYQLPDVFFSKDQGAFDKGHIVRREDVAWGETYALLRRANGDTYHVTNCSPQVANFNRSAGGEDNWGDLENLVFANAASERLCVFAGPILDDDDETFVGSAGNGIKLRVKIPRAYWKVVVARVSGGIAAYGFVLEQDLSDVPLEFTVSANFRRLMVPIEHIEDRARVRFPDSVRSADQIDDDRSLELAFRCGIERGTSDAKPTERDATLPAGQAEKEVTMSSQPASTDPALDEAAFEQARMDREGLSWWAEQIREESVLETTQLQGSGSTTPISQKAFDLIVEFEVSSKQTYEQKYRSTIWPQGESGVTIGIGYDVGYATKAQLWADWKGAIPDHMITALERALGVTGEAAKSLALALKSSVDISFDAAIGVHRGKVIPRWVALVESSLSNTHDLGPDSLGALVSLTYNRGASFSKAGDRYREMRAIKQHMVNRAFARVPAELRSMKRIWPSVPGLQARREREAKLFEVGLAST
ncbi:DNA/RNA non-specific endonuclease [Rhizobium ruizarguesonis]